MPHLAVLATSSKQAMTAWIALLSFSLQPCVRMKLSIERTCGGFQIGASLQRSGLEPGDDAHPKEVYPINGNFFGFMPFRRPGHLLNTT